MKLTEKCHVTKKRVTENEVKKRKQQGVTWKIIFKLDVIKTIMKERKTRSWTEFGDKMKTDIQRLAWNWRRKFYSWTRRIYDITSGNKNGWSPRSSYKIKNRKGTRIDDLSQKW